MTVCLVRHQKTFRKTIHYSTSLLTRHRNDLDIYDLYRDFTNNEVTYPVTEFQAWIASLHSNNQHYVPIIDSNIYVSNPDNESDAYPPWERVSRNANANVMTNTFR
jgi:hypothetical protein